MAAEAHLLIEQKSIKASLPEITWSQAVAKGLGTEPGLCGRQTVDVAGEGSPLRGKGFQPRQLATGRELQVPGRRRLLLPGKRFRAQLQSHVARLGWGLQEHQLTIGLDL